MHPRFLGSAPDIGAFEFVPPGTTVTQPRPPPPPVSPALLQQSSGATLNSSVLASRVLVKPTAAARKQKLTIGKANFSVPAGRTKNVRLKVSKPALKLLKEKGKLKAIANLTATANGSTKKSTKKVTLKRKR